MARPFHVAFEDSYVWANWDDITALCKFNGIPFDATGEKVRREGLWCVYQYGQQLDAMMAWDRFKGHWMLGEKFSYPVPPDKMPTMKEVSRPKALRSHQTEEVTMTRAELAEAVKRIFEVKR